MKREASKDVGRLKTWRYSTFNSSNFRWNKCGCIQCRAVVLQKNDSRKPNYYHVLQYNGQCSSVWAMRSSFDMNVPARFIRRHNISIAKFTIVVQNPRVLSTYGHQIIADRHQAIEHMHMKPFSSSNFRCTMWTYQIQSIGAATWRREWIKKPFYDSVLQYNAMLDYVVSYAQSFSHK